MRSWTRLPVATLVALLAADPVPAQDQAEPVSIQREGAHLRVNLADGTSISGDRLIGLEVELDRAGDDPWWLRFDGVGPDPRSTRPGVLLYDVSVRTEPDAAWQKFCLPDPWGQTTALVVPGHFEDGATGGFVPGAPGAFSLACTADPPGKCIRYGYPPWDTTPGGVDLAPYHAACVRMIRADYCGDGTSHTNPGIGIQILDRIGVNRDSGAAVGAFEAVWGEAGALCLAHPRLPGTSLDDLYEVCPRLAETPPEACSLDKLDTLTGARLANRS